MNKAYPLFYYFNLLLGAFIMIYNCLVVEYKEYSILLVLFIVVFDFVMIVKYINNKQKPNKLDMKIMLTYILFVIALLSFSMIYQFINTVNFNISYFSKLLVIPYFIVSINGVIKED